MNQIEEAAHIRSAFRQMGNDDARKINLVIQLRDVALKYFPPAVIAKVPPPYFSDEIRSAYQAIGQNLEWNLTILGDTGAYAFWFAARDAGLTPSQQSAADLLYACTKAIEASTLSDHLEQNILDAIRGLDLDLVTTGKKFTQGRQPNTGGVIRKAVTKALSKNPTLKNVELWNALALKPPKGWCFYDNRAGKYTEGPNAPSDGQSYARFCTIASEERKKIMQ